MNTVQYKVREGTMLRVNKTVKRMGVGLVLLLAFALALPAFAYNDGAIDDARGPVSKGFRVPAEYIDEANRTIDVGLLWMTITNHGYFGNDAPGRNTELIDPCTGEWAVQAEYPGGTGVQYLYQAGLWIGAMIQEEGFEYPRVSVGTEGWFSNADPEFVPTMDIVERTTRSNAFNCLGDFIYSEDAISEQDMITSYADTSTVLPTGVLRDHPNDGPHVPLGIQITQRSYAWSYNYAQDFIIIDYEIENIADKYLKNLYIGLYVDADVGVQSTNAFEDDICGFKKTYEYRPAGSTTPEILTINVAYIADNDGRPRSQETGANLTAPHVTGTRVVRAPNPKLKTSFNWWISNGDAALDFGPAWEDDGSQGDWTGTFGTPVDDTQKYFVLKNREFDYDQVYVDDSDYINSHPQNFYERGDSSIVLESHNWRIADATNAADLANGYDTRYLISWGPLGVFDFIDESGNRVYRLNPGEKFSMTIAYVAGSNFHDTGDHFQPTGTVIDPTKFNFLDLQYNADWAAKVYDNPMIDTPDPITGLTDGWFGEDVGLDSLYALEEGDSISGFVDLNTGTPFEAIYPGPDEGEQDGRFQLIEDTAPRPQRFDYTYQNGLFDQGDGIPDFQGPPPPPTPILTSRTDGTDLYLQWGKFPSEDPAYRDPFSRQQDFEGYRIYVSNTGQETEYSFLAEFDKIDWSYYTESDSLLDSIYVDTRGLPAVRPFDTKGGTVQGYLKPVGLNIGMGSIAVTDSTYEFKVENASPMIPRYYAVTAYDYGDYRSGTEPLESAKSANALYIAPDRSTVKSKKPGVVPNPYRADQNYTQRYLELAYNDQDTTYVSWENRNDGTNAFYPQTDRRIYFYNLPRKCLIRIFTVSGDLVQIIKHDPDSPSSYTAWNTDHAEAWDLNSRNQQQVVSGLYLFSVEDKTEENKGNIDVGKFVIIR